MDIRDDIIMLNHGDSFLFLYIFPLDYSNRNGYRSLLCLTID